MGCIIEYNATKVMSVQFIWVQYLLMVSLPFLFVYQNFTVSLRKISN